jgi:hypothetical protein
MVKILRCLCLGALAVMALSCNLDHLDPKAYWSKMAEEQNTANRKLPELTEDGKLPVPEGPAN